MVTARDVDALHLQTPAGRLASGTGRGLVAYGGSSSLGRSRAATRGTRWPESMALVAAYVGCGAVAVAASAALGRDPLTCGGWLGTTGVAASLVSLGLGVLVGAATMAATPAMVRRFRWARDLGDALRPPAQYSAEPALLAIAVASATGEELLFRGLLVPVAGVVASSVVFGALHQVRGPGRWGWMLWATGMGLAFGAIFAATGSLAGPLFAHAAINHANLRYLRDTRTPPPRPLGGLLRR
jgi:CAAX protease family protein